MVVSTADMVRDLTSAIGEGKVDGSMPTRAAYRGAHSGQILLNELEHFTPGVVVWPESVEEVQKVVRLANEWGAPIVPQGGRTATYGAEGMKDAISMDLCRMHKIMAFDEEKYRFTAEAGACMMDILEYAAERGYMVLDIPGPAMTSQLGPRVAVHGYSKYVNRWGGVEGYLKGLEVVLPTGELVQLGRGTNGMKIPAKSGVSYNLMDLFLGTRGTLGIVTKVTEHMIKMPEVIEYDMASFSNFKDGIEAYIDLKQLCFNGDGNVWRAKGYSRRKLVAAAAIQELTFPDEIEWVTDFWLVGSREIVDATRKKVNEVIQAHGGSGAEDIGEVGTILKGHDSIEKYLGMAALKSDRVKSGGMSNRLILLDPVMSDENLVEFYVAYSELLDKIEGGKSYPSLSQALAILHNGAPIPLDLGYNKYWSVLMANTKQWDAEVRAEFLSWFREYAELIWKFGGSLTATHGFIPRELEIELVKKEMGEEEYRLMCRIKDLLDPNHIMNPKVRFEF
jgi:FAD/FMN-containing dehydrogenase